MAYTGTGTRIDPYIVNTWDDYLTLCVNDCYIKWEPNLTIDTVTVTAVSDISSSVQAIAITDFNGLTIGTFSVTTTYLDSTFRYAFRSTGKWSNITIQHLRVTTPSTYLAMSGNFYKCYFYDIQIENEFSGTGSVNSNRSGWCTIFKGTPIFVCCEIETLNTTGYPVAWAGHCKYCKLHYNVDVQQDNDYFLLPPQGMSYDIRYCYVDGIFKISNETISSAVIALHDYWQAGDGAYNPTVSSTNTIYNFKLHPILPESFKASLSFSTTSDYFDSGSSNVLWVNDPDNGLNCVVTNEAKQNGVILCTPADISNIQFLTDSEFTFIPDDDFRNTQFSDAFDFWDSLSGISAITYTSDDWNFRSNPKINGGKVFLPFYNYPTIHTTFVNKLDDAYIGSSQPTQVFYNNQECILLSGATKHYWQKDYDELLPSVVYSNYFNKAVDSTAAGTGLTNYRNRKTIEGTSQFVSSPKQNICTFRCWYPTWTGYFGTGFLIGGSYSEWDYLLAQPVENSWLCISGQSQNANSPVDHATYGIEWCDFLIESRFLTHCEWTISMVVEGRDGGDLTEDGYVLHMRMDNSETGTSVIQSLTYHPKSSVQKFITNINDSGTDTQIADNTKHYFTITCNHVTLCLYMDGVLIGQRDITDYDIIQDSFIGYITQSSVKENFEGWIYSLHIFGECLSATRVTELYHQMLQNSGK